jgi:hypothetical protein
LAVLEEVFKIGITIGHFNEEYHSAIDVTVWDGHLANKKLNSSTRDRQ